MSRSVSAVVTRGTECLGVVDEFGVDVPWWADVGPVVATLTERLGVRVVVLRLLHVTGGEGGRDGHVTYHVEAAGPPVRELRPADVEYADLVAPQRFRSPWATSAGLRELRGQPPSQRSPGTTRTSCQPCSPPAGRRQRPRLRARERE